MIVEPLRLACEPAAVGLVIAEDVQHRLALVAQPLVRLVQVAHDVDERTPPLLVLVDAPL
jgi:hypothetical protein